MPMLIVDRVQRSFGRIHAVRGVSFSVPRGQVVGLLGPNGAGKTTTIRMITGFTPPDAGRVTIDGDDVARATGPARRKIGYLPESAPLYAEMPARELLRFRGRLYGLRGRGLDEAVDRSIRRCWLTDVAHRRVGTLSKGYKQRVGLAGALLHNPPVLVLDEPTNGLDPTQVSETRSLIRELGRDRTLIISSHVLTEIERLCDRVLVIAAGTLRADAAPRDLVERAQAAPTYRVEIKCAGGWDRARIARAIQEVPGVGSIQESNVRSPDAGEWAVLHIAPGPGAGDLREPIAGAALGHGLLVRSLARESPTLEAVFLKLVESAA